jgi:ABC-type transport system substrate-binding protein
VKAHFVDAGTLFGDWDHGGIEAHGAFQVSLANCCGQADLDNWKFLLQSKYIDREQATHSVINQNSGGIHDALIDRAFDRAGSSYNLRVRSANYAAIQREVNKRAYWIPLNFPPFVWTSDHHVQNVTLSPSFQDPSWDAYAWKVRGH